MANANYKKKVGEEIAHALSSDFKGNPKKLNAEQQNEIANTPYRSPRREIAEKFGISMAYVSQLRSRRRAAEKRKALQREETEAEQARRLDVEYWGD